jgi:hypothetical protein
MIRNNKIEEEREKERERMQRNMILASKDSLPYLEKFCKKYEIELEVMEGKELDYEGVDYILKIKGCEPLYCSFRLIRSESKKFFIRYCGHNQGIGEAQKIVADQTKATVYITLELPTKTIRFYNMKDIKELLKNPNLVLNTGKDNSKYYTIHFTELNPILEDVLN